MDHPKFRTITTQARRPDGRLTRSYYSFPEGASYEVYRRIDRALVKAFGDVGTRTVGTFMDEKGRIIYGS